MSVQSQLASTFKSPPWNRDKELPRLTNLALRALQRMQDRQSNLFAFNWNVDTGQLGPISERYSAMATIGLLAATARGIEVPIPLDHVITALLGRLDAMENRGPGDLALLAWAYAMLHGKASRPVLERLLPGGKVEPLLAKLRTQQLASIGWTLSAFSFLYHKIEKSPLLEHACVSIADLIRSAFDFRTHLFRYHVERERGVKSMFGYHRCFGNFAVQSYPIYALSAYFQATGDERALRVANWCADKICSLQGPQGQWWWIYNVNRGTIADKFPVFAVHQDGMGPMALGKLSRVGKKDYHESIARSFHWLYGDNELGVSMINWEKNWIIRAIQRKPIFYKPSYHLNLLRSRFSQTGLRSEKKLAFGGMETLDETRPYHMGWMLLYFYDD
jgi:hypothetical protein